MLRVKCIRVPDNEGLIDANFIKGKFYNVQDVQQSMNGIQYFSILGELKTTVTAPAYCFCRPLKKKEKANVHRASRVSTRKAG